MSTPTALKDVILFDAANVDDAIQTAGSFVMKANEMQQYVWF